MNIQYSTLLVSFALLGAIVELVQAYRPPRSYKNHPKPWRPPRPRWHPYSSSSKYRHSKRRPPKDHYYRGPVYNRYAPFYKEPESVDDHPYTIVIQLPKVGDQQKGHPYRKNDDNEFNYEDNDYIDDNEDQLYDDRGLGTRRLGKKNLRFKVMNGANPKLYIKISRDDDANNIEFIDKSNLSANFETSTEVKEENWVVTMVPLSEGYEASTEVKEEDWVVTTVPLSEGTEASTNVNEEDWVATMVPLSEDSNA